MTKNISVFYGTDLEEAMFLERPNRFLIRCVLTEGVDANEAIARGSILEAHLPDPGRLKELLIPGQRVWLRSVNNPKRKTKWSAVLCERPGGAGLVSLDSTLPNRLIAKALAEGVMEEFKGWSFVRSEFKMGHSRWDFLLAGPDQRQLVLEVKSVTLVEDGVGLFPDAITARGAKHLRELAQIAQRHGWEAAVLFVMQRDDAARIEAAHSIDPNFAEALAEAKAAGVSVYGRRCRITLKEVILEDPVPVS
jgi:sugar fermentation stimulation protein A